jgi:hypothetical protein
MVIGAAVDTATQKEDGGDGHAERVPQGKQRGATRSDRPQALSRTV